MNLYPPDRFHNPKREAGPQSLCEETIVSPQFAEFLVCFYEDFLGHVFGIVEVAKLHVGERLDTRLVPVHEQAKCLRLSVEDSADYVSIFRSQFPHSYSKELPSSTIKSHQTTKV